MSRWKVVGGILCLALITLLQVGPAHADTQGDPGERPGLGAYADHDSTYVWGHRNNDRPAARSAATASRLRPRIVRTYVPACRGNLPQLERNLGTLCRQASELCASTPDPDDIGYWIYTASAGPPAPGPGDWTSTGQVVCRGANQPPDEIEPVVTAADFRRLPLPAAGLRVEPPSRQTLVNIPTNLFAASRTAILPTRILGLPVRVRATPLRFRWTYGDGGTLSTANAGGPYPQLDTAHTYRRPGRRTVQLSTTYRGEYSVTGGPWLPIDGVATVTSPSTTVTVRSAENELVAEPLN